MLPREHVIWQFKLKGTFGQTKWFEGINHNGQLLCFCFSDTSFIRTWVRTMWYSGRMQRNLSFFNVISAHKITIYVIKYFIGIDIRVIIWSWDRIGMVIIKAWYKRTNYKC